MNGPDEYKAEAMRLLDHYPLEACGRVAARLNGRGWKLDKFDCKVEIFGSIRWYAKVHIKTDLTKIPAEEKWAQLQAAFKALDLKVEKVTGAMTQVEDAVHVTRKYEHCQVMGRRLLRGYIYDFHVEFRPAEPLELSVLTEEDA